MSLAKPNLSPNPGGSRYPWEQWFQQKRFRLRKGVHFTGHVYGMRQTVYQAGKRFGLKLRLEVFDNALDVEVIE